MLVVVMGVSGSGKTAVGRVIAEQLALLFFDADDFHPPANVSKMASGVPLDDADRRPWLHRLHTLLVEQSNAGGGVLACSALKRAYRDRLRAGLEDSLRFVFLDVSRATLLERMRQREHFMPPHLLDSQLATLEAPGPDEAVHIDGDASIDEVVRNALASLS